MGKIQVVVSVPSPDEFRDFNDVFEFLDELTHSLNDYLSDIYNEFNGKIELVNQRVSEVTISDTGSANTEFEVVHNLGVVPKYYLWNINKNGVVYKGDTAWDSSKMYLKCSVANAEVKLVIYP